MRYEKETGLFWIDNTFFVDRAGLREKRRIGGHSHSHIPLHPFFGEDDPEIIRGRAIAKMLKKRSSINRKITSEDLARFAERHYIIKKKYRYMWEEVEVYNGSMIVAMRLEGFRFNKKKKRFYMYDDGTAGIYYPLEVSFNVSITPEDAVDILFS